MLVTLFRTFARVGAVLVGALVVASLKKRTHAPLADSDSANRENGMI